MYLTRLSLINFRNFTRFDADIPLGSILLVGGNAQGKTSLLEAIYFLATFTSFHASHDRQLINFQEVRDANPAVARIEAEFIRHNRPQHLAVSVALEKNGSNGGRALRKYVWVNGEKRKISQAIGQFNAVLFQPQMLRVIEGSPSERRRYLNLMLAQIYPDYSEALSTYDKVLTRRNALLKTLFDRSGAPDQLDYWDDILAGTGAVIMHTRIQAIREIEKHAMRTHQNLTRNMEVLQLDYRPSYEPLAPGSDQLFMSLGDPPDRSGVSREEIRSGLYRKLQSLHSHEIMRGVTTIGPHRDELRFMANGRDLGDYGSRGQIRTALLSMKMGEVTWMTDKTGQPPVFLLDEVLAELDPQRRADLLAHIQNIEQTLLTTTDLDLFEPSFIDTTTRWNIHQGALSSVVSRSG